jgi:leucyl-tRNA synthetase
LGENRRAFKRLVNQGMIQGVSSIIEDGSIQNFPTEVRVPVNLVQQGNRLYRKELEFLIQSDNRFEMVNADGDVAWKNDGQGEYIVLRNEVEKMSKRYMNVVNPDDVIAQFGADCFRMFEMFLGPIDQSKPWDTQSIGGVSRFLQKLWRLFNFNEAGVASVSDRNPTSEELKILHKTIKKVNEDIERLSFNTSVSAFMVCVNELGKQKEQSKSILEQLVVLIAPFAPFIAETLWEKLGYSTCVLEANYPTHDEKYLVESIVTYPISINGKVRATMDFATDEAVDVIEKAVMQNEIVIKWLEGNPPKKVIVVHGRIVNIVK